MRKKEETGVRKKRRAGNIVITIIIVSIFVVGAGLLLYPTFSNLWNEYRNQQLITDYNDSVQSLDNSEIERIRAEAKAYNDQHTVNQIVDAFTEEEDYILTHPYDQLLNPNGDEIMGSIVIPKIGVNLAIYHGLGKDTLEKGVGHCEGTSLPIGGESTHAVLAGHRGLPSAKLFTDLDQLETGDVFYIKVLDETLAYKVDQIKTVLPEETEDLAIVPGKDYVTLITCTPYGVNTHRLLVRGTRIPYTPDMAEDVAATEDNVLANYLPFILLAIGILVFVIIALIMWKRSKRK
ncbi:MAG: class C sortase [Anaerovoracaceae bacterium]|jgi:sortase A